MAAGERLQLFARWVRAAQLLGRWPERERGRERSCRIFITNLRSDILSLVSYSAGHTDQAWYNGRGPRKDINTGGGVIKSHLGDWLPPGRNQRR